MIKTLIAALLLVTQAHAAAPTKEISRLASFNLIFLAKGFEAAKINATDVDSSAYDVRGLNNIKDLKKYAEKATGAELEEVIVKTDKKGAVAYKIAEALMSGDSYATADLTNIGQLIQPLTQNILGNRSIVLFWGSSSDEEFHATHTVVVAIDKDSKEMLVLTVGYSE